MNTYKTQALTFAEKRLVNSVCVLNFVLLTHKGPRSREEFKNKKRLKSIYLDQATDTYSDTVLAAANVQELSLKKNLG